MSWNRLQRAVLARFAAALPLRTFPHVMDEIAYVLHAKTLAMVRPSTEAMSPKDAFNMWCSESLPRIRFALFVPVRYVSHMARDEYAAVLETLRHWPPAKRLALAEDLIRSVRARSAGSHRATLELAEGLLLTGSPPPDDAECQRIIDDARAAKYGA